MSSKSIKVFAPASVSNVGPGFDILGFALHEPGDEIILKKSNNSGLKITSISGDNGKLPHDVENNTATAALISLMKSLKIEEGISVEINKKMGLGSGLGSSAASAVGAVIALNELLDLKLEKKSLLEHALAGEFVASKAIHADNVAPSLFGGIVLIRSYNPIDIIQIPPPEKLYCTIIYPDVEIKTSEARAMLPDNVPLKDIVSQTGNIASLIYGLSTGDYSLISRSLKDKIIEPVRSKLIPGYEDIKQATLDAGALGSGISGSGPSIFAFSDSMEIAQNIAVKTKRAVDSLNINSITYISKINQIGPRILD